MTESEVCNNLLQRKFVFHSVLHKLIFWEGSWGLQP